MKKIFKILIILLIIILLSCPLNEGKKIAVFKSGKITFNEAKVEFERLDENDKNKLIELDDYFKFIRKISLEKIILNKAYEKKLNADDEIKKRIENSENTIALKILFDKNINSKIKIDSKDYEKYTKLFELYQIVKRHDILDENKIEESKKLLKNISEKIQNIDDFKNYASKISDDITKDNGGYVGKISLGIMENSIDEVIKDLNINTVSPIVESSVGFHIFYITKIENADIDDLYRDNKLYELIYNEKKAYLEENWYNKLLKDSSLFIDEKKILTNDNPDEIVIKYKNKKITNKEFYNTVNSYKNNSFPDPSKDDLIRLSKNLGLQLILDHLSNQGYIKNSNDFKNANEYNKKLILIDEYIKKNAVINPITENDIKNFYDKNKKTLFTFIDYKGSLYIQPMNEVIKFIEQNLQDDFIKQARFDLYKKLVDEEQLKISDDSLKNFKKYLKR